MDKMFFDDWASLGRTLTVSVLAYVALVAFLRISGRRTLAKMNAFDLVVTVALGSTLATIMLNKGVTLAQGTLALVLLVSMQFAVTWTSVRVRWVRRFVTGEPVLLFHRGEFLRASMKVSRVTEDDVRAAMRGAGKAAMGEIDAVVLETDGSFSVVGGDARSMRSSLAGVMPASADDGRAAWHGDSV